MYSTWCHAVLGMLYMQACAAQPPIPAGSKKRHSFVVAWLMLPKVCAKSESVRLHQLAMLQQTDDA